MVMPCDRAARSKQIASLSRHWTRSLRDVAALTVFDWQATLLLTAHVIANDRGPTSYGERAASPVRRLFSIRAERDQLPVTGRSQVREVRYEV